MCEPKKSDSDDYKELCPSYRAMDEFRTKLLGFLPLATAAGVVALFGKDLSFTQERLKHLEPVAIFGVLTTCGLYAYELYGITKCHYLIETGKCLERRSLVPGQFATRPTWVINEPFAAAIIYPAVVAAWTFMAVLVFHWIAAVIVATVVFLIGFCLTIIHAQSLDAKWLKDHPELKEN